MVEWALNEGICSLTVHTQENLLYWHAAVTPENGGLMWQSSFIHVLVLVGVLDGGPSDKMSPLWEVKGCCCYF